MKVTSFEDFTGLWGKIATDGEKPEIFETFCLCLHWYFCLLMEDADGGSSNNLYP